MDRDSYLSYLGITQWQDRLSGAIAEHAPLSASPCYEVELSRADQSAKMLAASERKDPEVEALLLKICQAIGFDANFNWVEDCHPVCSSTEYKFIIVMGASLTPVIEIDAPVIKIDATLADMIKNPALKAGAWKILKTLK